MRYRLDLVLKPAEGALVRVIGMTERRGFRPCAIQGAAAPDAAGRWHLQLDVDSSRPPETLRLQLEKGLRLRIGADYCAGSGRGCGMSLQTSRDDQTAVRRCLLPDRPRARRNA